MPVPIVTVVVPTLAGDDAWAACLRSLENQTLEDFEVVVVDNSGAGRVKTDRARVIANKRNVGFGAAINQGIRTSQAAYIATLNDDAVADVRWLEALVAAAENRSRVGMCASQVRLADSGKLDSAGMLIAADGSSKQRGHGEDPVKFAKHGNALCPSGSAALYRRAMLDEIGLFDEEFFLYCEDTDLGLRARRAGWECAYVPDAMVEHRYSHSAGRASPMKAYYVERNRLYTAVKNLPLPMLIAASFAALARYFWHFALIFQGRGKAAEFRRGGNSAILLPLVVLRAHAAALFRLPRLLAERAHIRRLSRLSSREFRSLLARHSISVRKVAEL
ncbi:MAG: glycosyltransferase family 2 protein [Bryobacteraceae bacterium]